LTNFIIIAVSFLAGMAFKRFRIFPVTTPDVLNQYIIYIPLPAITLYYIQKLELDAGMLYPVVTPWLVFVIAFMLFYALYRMQLLEKKTAGALTLLCGLGNTSFLGFPMVEMFYGKEGLQTAVLCDQPGSFTVLSTIGIATAVFYSSGKTGFGAVFKRMFTFPPFVFFVAALFLRGVAFPGWLDISLLQLGGTLTPAALVSVGFQLNFSHISSNIRTILLGLVYKLAAAPALFYLLYIVVQNGDSQVIKITILEAAMAPMITAGVIASKYDLKPSLVSGLLGLGIPLSFVTVYIWYLLLS